MILTSITMLYNGAQFCFHFPIREESVLETWDNLSYQQIKREHLCISNISFCLMYAFALFSFYLCISLRLLWFNYQLLFIFDDFFLHPSSLLNSLSLAIFFDFKLNFCIALFISTRLDFLLSIFTAHNSTEGIISSANTSVPIHERVQNKKGTELKNILVLFSLLFACVSRSSEKL